MKTFDKELHIYGRRTNPCPCGYYGFSDGVHYCECSPAQIKRYIGKISGPILDRIDIHISVPAVKPEELKKGQKGETSKVIRERVIKAHEIQKRRFKESRCKFNSRMGKREIERFCKLEPEAEEVLSRAVRAFGLSARSFYRVLKLARTIADLDGDNKIGTVHIAEALSYRKDNN